MVLLEGRAAVASDITGYSDTATTERGPPLTSANCGHDGAWPSTHQRQLRPRQSVALQLTSNTVAPDHLETCAQNAQKLRCKGLKRSTAARADCYIYRCALDAVASAQRLRRASTGIFAAVRRDRLAGCAGAAARRPIRKHRAGDFASFSYALLLGVARPRSQ